MSQPRTLFYLSDRLANDLGDEHRASKPRKLERFVVRLPPFSVTSESTDRTERENPYRMADVAREAAADVSGTVEDPGRYLYLKRVHVRLWAFRFTVPGGLQVALGSIDDRDVVVALVGSVGNLRGYAAPADPGSGWIPSDPLGIRTLVTTGSLDDDVDDRTVAMDAAYLVLSITRRPDIDTVAETLLKVHSVHEATETIGLPTRGLSRLVHRIIVASPVFVREPEAVPVDDTRGGTHDAS